MAIALQTVELRLFGEPALLVQERGVSFAGFPKLPALLAYLALHDGPVRRDQLAFTLWPDDTESAARANLRRTLHRFQTLAAPCSAVDVSSSTLALRRDAVKCDLWEFEEILRTQPPSPDAVRRALELHKGGLLEHCEDEWLQTFRQRLREKLLSALALAGDAESARALLVLDPYREDAVRTLMSAQAAEGDRAGALSTFRDFASRLRNEFGVEPDAQTVALNEELTRSQAPRRTHNLPFETDPFIGRAADLSALESLYASRRMVTICGPPGVGKSRLALHYAHTTHASREETWYVQLAGARDAAGLLDAFLSVLHARPEPQESALDALARSIGDRRMLLVADTADHLIEPAGSAMAHLLACCPNAAVLCTSREALKIAGEAVLRIEPLPLEDARELLADRATAAGGASAGKDRATLDRLCAALEGIPLALELAAAQCGVLPLSAIAQALHADPSALPSTRRATAPHQQTLQDTIAWSYLLLSPEQSRCLRLLTVFPQSWTMEAAVTVCGNAAPSIVEKSFAHAIEAPSGRRYALYDSVRGFALRHRSAGEEHDALGAFVHYYRTHSQALADELTGPDQARALESLRAEAPNIAAVLRVARETDAPWGAQFVLALYRYWLTRGSYDDAREWMEHFAQTASGASERARCRAAASVLSSLLGDVARAEELLHHTETVLDDAAHSELHHAAGVLAHERADIDKARDEFEASLHHARRTGDRVRIARALDNLGTEYTFLRQFERAREALNESLDLYRGLGGAESIAWVLYHLAGVAFEEEHLEDALALVRESFEIRREIGHVYGIALSHYAMAQAEFALGRFEESERNYLEALRLWKNERQRSWIALVLDALAGVAAARRKYERAGILSQAASRLREELAVALRAHDLRMHDAYISDAFREDAAAFESGKHLAQSLSEDRCIELALTR